MSGELGQRAVGPEVPEEKSTVLTLAVQLVVIPLAVVAFCVGLGALFMWLTAERKDFGDYVNALKTGSAGQRGQQAQFLLNYVQDSKRWQGIFDMTAQISADRDQFLARNPSAVADIVRIFDEAATPGSDMRTRRYLALVLGILGDAEAAKALRTGLADSDPETVKNCVWALGRLGDEESAGRIIELTRHDEMAVRLTAVYTLGLLQDARARDVLAASLNDPDELVKWNAAFALARRGDRAGWNVLVRLLDKAYMDKFTEVTNENRSRYRVAAVEWLVKLDVREAGPKLMELSRNDPDLRVRDAALQAVKKMGIS